TGFISDWRFQWLCLSLVVRYLLTQRAQTRASTRLGRESVTPFGFGPILGRRHLAPRIGYGARHPWSWEIGSRPDRPERRVDESVRRRGSSQVRFREDKMRVSDRIPNNALQATPVDAGLVVWSRWSGVPE